MQSTRADSQGSRSAAHQTQPHPSSTTCITLPVRAAHKPEPATQDKRMVMVVSRPELSGHSERSGRPAEAVQLIRTEVELNGPGRVKDGLRA